MLVVEDEPHAALVVARRLRREGFCVEVVATLGQALACVSVRMPDLVVLDVGSGNGDIPAAMRGLRRLGNLPVVMISPLGDAAERIWGLSLGADDFVPGPLLPDELVERVRCVLRRNRPLAPTPPPAQLLAGPLVLDERSRRVRVGGSWVTLTALEFSLLAFLARHPHHAFSREELLRQVWGYTFGDGATVTVHVRRLREKIEADPAHPVLVATVWGVGYRFDPAPAAPATKSSWAGRPDPWPAAGPRVRANAAGALKQGRPSQPKARLTRASAAEPPSER